MQRIIKYKKIVLLVAVILALGVSAQATLAYITAQSAEVVNTFIPVKSLNIDVSGEKTLEGREWQKTDVFEFSLTEIDEAGEPIGTVASTTATAISDGSHGFSFSDAIKQHIDSAGVYHYSITEVTGSDENMIYSEDDYRFTVTATEDEVTGSLAVSDVQAIEGSDANIKTPEIILNEETGKYEIRVSFENTYKEPPIIVDPEPIDVTLTVDKKMEYKNGDREEGIGPEGFLFTLEEDSEVDAKHQQRTDSSGEAVFNLKYDKEDAGKTYIYTLKEVDEALDRVEYSEEEYEIHITITETDNVLSAEITCDGNRKDTFKFTNVYSCEEATTQPTEPEDNTEAEEDTSGSDSLAEGDGTKTGDDMNLILPIVLMCVAALTVIIVMVTRRKKLM